MTQPLKILALCSIPVEAAATRFRLQQFVEPLRERGIELTISPFLSSSQFRALYTPGGIPGKAASMAAAAVKRIAQAASAVKYDAVIVQREAMLFGPALIEWLVNRVLRLPMVLDLDDATYVQYVSPTYGKVGSWLKFFGKTDRLIDSAAVVTCGNRFIAEYAEARGAKAVVVPTVVDLEEFKPRERNDDPQEPLTVGWIGTHSTFPFLRSIFPVLERSGKVHNFRLKVVGAGTSEIELRNVEVENVEWSMAREPSDFASLDIGLYPINVSDSANEEWIKGKSGFKAVQYMAVGVPFVMSPVGVCSEIGEPGNTHFNAVTDEDWYNALDNLLSNGELRRRMGDAGRAYAVDHYGSGDQADSLARIFRSVCRGS